MKTGVLLLATLACMVVEKSSALYEPKLTIVPALPDDNTFPHGTVVWLTCEVDMRRRNSRETFYKNDVKVDADYGEPLKYTIGDSSPGIYQCSARVSNGVVPRTLYSNTIDIKFRDKDDNDDNDSNSKCGECGSCKWKRWGQHCNKKCKACKNGCDQDTGECLDAVDMVSQLSAYEPKLTIVPALPDDNTFDQGTVVWLTCEVDVRKRNSRETFYKNDVKVDADYGAPLKYTIRDSSPGTYQCSARVSNSVVVRTLYSNTIDIKFRGNDDNDDKDDNDKKTKCGVCSSCTLKNRWGKHCKKKCTRCKNGCAQDTGECL